MSHALSVGQYPKDWPELANRIKDEAGWKCERCKHGHAPLAGYSLTVHHLDHDKSNEARWNLAALCQRCHLQLESMSLYQIYMLTQQANMFGFNATWLEWRIPYIREAIRYENPGH